MAYENSAGINVFNQYGVRETGGAVGVETSDDSITRVRVDFTGASLNSGFVPPVSIPKGALFLSYHLRVDEVFVVTGTTPSVEVGAAGSIATDGIVITEAELENLGTKKLASIGAGTWALASTTGTTAAALLDFQLEGDTVVAATSGKATLILEYINVTKV